MYKKELKNKEWFEKNWRVLEENEMPIVGDAWFPGGFCSCLEPKILDKTDSLDPVGLQDDKIFRKKNIKYKAFWDFEKNEIKVINK